MAYIKGGNTHLKNNIYIYKMNTNLCNIGIYLHILIIIQDYRIERYKIGYAYA